MNVAVTVSPARADAGSSETEKSGGLGDRMVRCLVPLARSLVAFPPAASWYPTLQTTIAVPRFAWRGIVRCADQWPLEPMHSEVARPASSAPQSVTSRLSSSGVTETVTS